MHSLYDSAVAFSLQDDSSGASNIDNTLGDSQAPDATFTIGDLVDNTFNVSDLVDNRRQNVSQSQTNSVNRTTRDNRDGKTL